MMMSCDHFTCGVFISVKRKSLKKWIVRFRSAYTQQTVMPLKWNVFSLALLLVLLLYFGYSFTVFPFFCGVMQKVPLSFVPPYSVCQQFSVCVCVCHCLHVSIRCSDWSCDVWFNQQKPPCPIGPSSFIFHLQHPPPFPNRGTPHHLSPPKIAHSLLTPFLWDARVSGFMF